MVSGNTPALRSDDVCWICLDDHQDEQGLFAPCKCPRKVHPKCLARWQLQQAGRPEETHCRFCTSPLADWKASLTPEGLKPEVQKVQPIMVVYFEGEIHRIPVKQGTEGLKEFTGRIRDLFRLPEDVDISLTFGCKEPMSGQHLKLEGIGAFDAAVHCASVAAAERQAKLRTQSSSHIPAQRALSAQTILPSGPGDERVASPVGPSTPVALRQANQPWNHRRVRSFYSPRSDRPPLPSSGSVPAPDSPQGSTSSAPVGGIPSPSSRGIFGSLGRNRRQRETGDEMSLSDSSSSRYSCDPAEMREPEEHTEALGARRSRRVPSKCGDGPLDVPASDEALGMGSLTGRLKFTLKAFSRKVARSFSFSKNVSPSSPRSQTMSRSQSNCDTGPNLFSSLPTGSGLE